LKGKLIAIGGNGGESGLGLNCRIEGQLMPHNRKKEIPDMSLIRVIKL